MANEKEETKTITTNGMTEAVYGATGFNPLAPQISQTDTLFENARGYMISNQRQLLSQIYVELGLIETIIDLPVEDGLRGGIEIHTDQLDPDEVKDLVSKMEEMGDLEVYGQGEKWKRLFGGGGILILTDQDPETPLDMESIKQGDDLEFVDVDMWELYHDAQIGDDRVTTDLKVSERLEKELDYFNYYGKKIHKSRVILLKGKKAPSMIRQRLRGWGISVVETLIQAVNQYLKANNLIFEVMDEFKIDYYKLKNLTNTLLSETGTEIVQKRIQLANVQKNFLNAVTMDAEDDFQQKTLDFAGISEAMVGIRMSVASAMRIPVTKLFGISAAGFSSGEDDIENYNAMIESTIRNKGKHNILKIVKLRCQQMYGSVPTDLSINFKPLRILSSEQEENVKTSKFTRIQMAKASGDISSLEFRQAINKDNLLGIQLDTTSSDISDELGAPGGDDEKSNVTPISGAKGTKSATQAPDVPATKNSLEFDKAEFEAEGGDQLYLHQPIGRFDKTLMKKAEEQTMKAYGKDRWQFRYWLYKKLGGKIS